MNLPEEAEVGLLKEVQARGAHLAGFGRADELFEAVAKSMNESGLLPWKTDTKNCRDRFKYLIKSWKKSDKCNQAKSGTTENFTEFDKLCADLSSETEDVEIERDFQRERVRARDETLIAAGEEVRNTAMNRRQFRDTSEGAVTEGSDSQTTPSKKRRLSNNNDDLSRAIDCLEDAEKKRTELQLKTEERENKKMLLDTNRFEFEQLVHESNKRFEEQRMALEKRRLQEQAERDLSQSTERREMMELQREMLRGMRQRDSNQSEERVASLNVQKELLQTLRLFKK